jgi:hypothetical protein
MLQDDVQFIQRPLLPRWVTFFFGLQQKIPSHHLQFTAYIVSCSHVHQFFLLPNLIPDSLISIIISCLLERLIFEWFSVAELAGWFACHSQAEANNCWDSSSVCISFLFSSLKH